MSLFLYYKVSFIVAALSAAILSQIGKHYYSRGIILEVFFLSQLVLLGNLCSKLLFHSSSHSNLSGVTLSFILFFLGKLFLHKKNLLQSEKSTFMVGGYLFLLSLQYLIIGIFPQLDSHMSIGFLGNMVTSSKFENFLMIITFSLFSVSYFFSSQKTNKNTIEINILNSEDKSLFELFLFSIPLVISLYSLGFLYTMSFLLLPSLILGPKFSSEKQAVLTLSFLSAFASTSGLALSIYYERLSTTSVQIFLLVLLLSFIFLYNSFQKNN